MNLEKLNAGEIKLEDQQTPAKEEMSETMTDQTVGEGTENEEQVFDRENKKAAPPPHRVAELIDQRQANCRVFRMSDGTEQAVFYSEPLFAKNAKTGAYEDIDNTLEEDEDHRYFKNKRGDFSARFNNEKESGELFTIEKEGHSITVLMRHNSQERKKGVQIYPVVKENQNGSDLLFQDILPNTNIAYNVSGRGVKENIMIKEKKKVYRYSFLLRCQNLVVENKPEARIVLFSDPETGEEIFRIPEPLMADASGESSIDIRYDMYPMENGDFAFNIVADSHWINDENRTFPVCIDPQIVTGSSDKIRTYLWQNGTVHSSMAAEAKVGHVLFTDYNNNSSLRLYRTYIRLQNFTNDLPYCAKILKAELQMKQISSSCTDEQTPTPLLAMYEVNGQFDPGCACTPTHQNHCFDYEVGQVSIEETPDDEPVDYEFDEEEYEEYEEYEEEEEEEDVTYTWDVTKMLEKAGNNGLNSVDMVLKLANENDGDPGFVLYGSGSNLSLPLRPSLCITYKSSYGIDAAAQMHTHALGEIGQSQVDVKSGVLSLDLKDFEWNGNRMPISLHHMYNSALKKQYYTRTDSIHLHAADYKPNASGGMKLGRGWRLNVQLGMILVPSLNKYVFTDETGEELYFSQSSACNHLWQDDDGQGMQYDTTEHILTGNGKSYKFDSDSGRILTIEDQNRNKMQFYYATDSTKRITGITDSTNREFSFFYDTNGFLTQIQSPDGQVISYEYDDNEGLLTAITYADGQQILFFYSYERDLLNMEIKSENQNTGLKKLVYTYQYKRVKSISEFDRETEAYQAGKVTTFDYSLTARRTIVRVTEPADGTESATTKATVYAFDGNGNVVNQYEYADESANSGNIPDDDGVRAKYHPANLLFDHDFNSLSHWCELPSNDELFQYARTQTITHFGSDALQMTHTSPASCFNGVHQTTIMLPAGEYTFSAYVKNTSQTAKVYLQVYDLNNQLLATSESLSDEINDFVRLYTSFTLGQESQVDVRIMLANGGTVYVDSVQLENNAYVTDYNLLYNGNFALDSLDWYRGPSYAVVPNTTTAFHMGSSMKILGSLEKKRELWQKVFVKTEPGTRESFTFSGWAKGQLLPNRESRKANKSVFCLFAKIVYNGGLNPDYFTADFPADTDNKWMQASLQFSKQKFGSIQYIVVGCRYGYSDNEVFVDDFALTRDNIETGLTQADFTDENDNGGSCEPCCPQSEEFSEAKDSYGNVLTSTTFAKDNPNAGAIYRSFTYSQNGNDLIAETDARGNTTQYQVDEDTSRNTAVIDRCGNKKVYQYDETGHVTQVTDKNANEQTIASVSYTYDALHALSAIQRGDGLRYALTRDEFHHISGIGIDGKPEALTTYTYKKGSDRLKAVTYANGDHSTLRYNALGQLISETWENGLNQEKFRAKYTYDGNGNIVRSLDFTHNKEYDYVYTDDVLSLAREYNVLFTNEIVTSKTLCFSTYYRYNEEHTLIEKRVVWPGDLDDHTMLYQYTGENNVSVYRDGTLLYTTNLTNDALDRKQSLTVNGRTKTYFYADGIRTQQHILANINKGAATTQLISKIQYADGTELRYSYDNEERITQVSNKENTDIVNYTYDAQGQLLTETRNGNTVNTMTYDGYGNIVSKNGIAYTYHNTWKDLLVCYGAQTISYDVQGNPTSYLGHTLTWEKGRQLKFFDNNTYTYNADGIRTSKTVNGVTHTYWLEGSKILHESLSENDIVTHNLDPLYDAEESVCGIVYDGTPYYFEKNLQDDVIAIVDAAGCKLADYQYDAWGVCTIQISANCSCAGVVAINPFRYRSYYYDAEIGMYYLQSRYYDPVVGRFINGDDCEISIQNPDIKPLNLFGYCGNDPVNYYDPYGLEAITVGIVTVSIGALIAIITTVLLVALLAICFQLHMKDFADRPNIWIILLISKCASAVAQLENVLSNIAKKAKNGKRYRQMQNHHIVAQKAIPATLARAILISHRLSVNAPYNIVAISNTLHRHLHTLTYYQAINTLIMRVNRTLYAKYRIVAALLFVASLLLTIDKCL